METRRELWNTEPRYILVILVLWLSIITGYFLISRKDNIKIIPISLCVLALLAIYGPQSAFSVSRYSQSQRLKKILNAKDAYAQKEKPAIIRYLVLNHGLESLQPFTTVDLQAVSQHIEKKSGSLKRYAYQRENDLLDTAFALFKVNKAAAKSRSSTVFFVTKQEGIVAVKGFDYVTVINSYAQKQDNTLNGAPLIIEKLADNKLQIKIANDPILIIDTNPRVDSIRNAYLNGKMEQQPGSKNLYLPGDGLRINVNGKGHELTLVLTELTLSTASGGESDNYNYKGFLLVKIK
ncbi:hypothetical protein AAKU52_000520 [Pedobacter sp. CG_S7]|uniref:hypothetical protein n=1 Tax=Pedobacter sp. CG_S7 TaxID=3143930 RepID=UPI0033921FDF